MVFPRGAPLLYNLATEGSVPGATEAPTPPDSGPVGPGPVLIGRCSGHALRVHVERHSSKLQPQRGDPVPSGGGHRPPSADASL